jgi:hypothetical protein
MGSGRGSGVQGPGTGGRCRPHDFSTERGLRNIPDRFEEEQLKRLPGGKVNVNLHTSRPKEAEIGTAQRSEMTRRLG